MHYYHYFTILDQELLFNMLMLVECVRISGEHLLPYLPSIEAVLQRSLLMASKEGQGLATSLLRNVLRALTLTYPNEFRSVAEGYDRPGTNCIKKAFPEN